MKKRNEIVFALCAIACAAGFYACSDDSGKVSGQNIEEPGPEKPEPGVKAKLSAEPATFSFYNGDVKDVALTGEPNANVSVRNNADTCGNVVENIKIGNDGKATLRVEAIGEAGCSGRIDLSDGNSSYIINYNVLSKDTPILSANPTSITLDPDAVGSFEVSYMLDGVGQDGSFTLVSSNETCVGLDKKDYNFVDGKAEVAVHADGENCNAGITVSGPNNSQQIVNVTVNAAPVVQETYSLSIAPASLTIPYAANATGDYRIEYVNSKGEGVGNAELTLSLDNNACVSLSAESITTGGDGSYAGKVFVVGSDCNAKLTVTDDAGNTASMNITVTSQTEYDVKVAAKYDSSKFETIEHVSVFLNNFSCSEFNADDIQSYKNKTPKKANERNSSKPILTTFNLTKVPVATPSVLVTGKPSADPNAPVLAYGCKDISLADQDTTVTVDMIGIPADIKGTYDVVSNFDLTSGFTKPSAKEYNIAQYTMPMVEDMSAGAWVQFVVDFCKKPVDSLLAFIWSNTLDRLKTIDGMPGWVTEYILGSGKTLALPMLKPIIEKYLNEYGWYTTLTTISPDVADLTTNMQLTGTFKIDNVSGNVISDVAETFGNLEYQWSLKQPGEAGCLTATDHYVSDKCRMNLPLGNNAISGTWSGNADYDGSAGNDGLLTIDKHSVSFKWASILFTAVFGSILPTALDYELETGSSNKPLYIKSFLNVVVFKPLIEYYVNNRSGQPMGDDGKTYPPLKQTEICNKGIETLVYLVYADVGNNDFGASAIGVVTNYACGESGVGKLDDLVLGALDGIQASSDNTFKLYSNECPMYNGGTLQYQAFGEADDPIHTANDIANGSSTKRCQWDIDVTMKEKVKDENGNDVLDDAGKPTYQDKHIDVKGFFHANRHN